MTRKFFILLTQAFCEQYKGYRQGANVFNYAVTIDGRFVAALNTLSAFSELFPADYTPEVITIMPEEFPVENPAISDGL